MEKITKEDELELISINNNSKDTVRIPRTNKSYNIGWIKEITKEKLSLLELNSGIDATSDSNKRNVKKRAKFLSKCASLIILNGIKIHFFYWILWRYLYYIKGYSADQLLPIIQVAKKKVMQVESYLAMVLVSQMNITGAMLTMEEQERLQAELLSAQNQRSEKNTNGL